MEIKICRPDLRLNRVVFRLESSMTFVNPAKTRRAVRSHLKLDALFIPFSRSIVRIDAFCRTSTILSLKSDGS